MTLSIVLPVFNEQDNIPAVYSKIIENLKVNTEKGYIITNKNQETNIKGFYAAGDITNNELKQIVTAASQGAIAANTVYRAIASEK